MMDSLPTLVKETSLFVGNDYDTQAPQVHQYLGSKARFAPPHLWNLRASWVGWLGLRDAEEKGFDRMSDLSPLYLRTPDIRTSPLPQTNFAHKSCAGHRENSGPLMDHGDFS